MIWHIIRRHLERVWRLFLSVQRFQGIQELSVHSEYPLVIARYHQVSVIRRQAMELNVAGKNGIIKSLLWVYVKRQTAKFGDNIFPFIWDIMKIHPKSHANVTHLLYANVYIAYENYI